MIYLGTACDFIINGLNHTVEMDNCISSVASSQIFFSKTDMHAEELGEEDPETQMRCQRLN